MNNHAYWAQLLGEILMLPQHKEGVNEMNEMDDRMGRSVSEAGITREHLAASINGGYVLLERKLDLRKLYVEITNRCNLSCTMCFRNNWEEEDGDMSFGLFRELMKQAEKFSMMEEVFFGGIGEPTTHPDFLKFVEEASKRYRVSFSTNGILMDRIAREIVRLGLTGFTSLWTACLQLTAKLDMPTRSR